MQQKTKQSDSTKRAKFTAADRVRGTTKKLVGANVVTSEPEPRWTIGVKVGDCQTFVPLRVATDFSVVLPSLPSAELGGAICAAKFWFQAQALAKRFAASKGLPPDRIDAQPWIPNGHLPRYVVLVSERGAGLVEERFAFEEAAK